MTEWREDLKSTFKVAGVDGKPTVFLFADTQIKLEGFVEDINNILNTGEVPNLFAKDEQSEIVESLNVRCSITRGVCPTLLCCCSCCCFDDDDDDDCDDDDCDDDDGAAADDDGDDGGGGGGPAAAAVC